MRARTDVLARGPDSSVTRRHVGQVAAALRPRDGGGMVLALEREFAVTDAGWSSPRILGSVSGGPRVRLNEGGCDPQGRFYCGTMAYDAAPGAGALYRLDRTGRSASSSAMSRSPTGSGGARMAAPLTTWTPPPTGSTRSASTELTPLSTAAAWWRKSDPHLGSPDGLTIDAEGGIWVALWDGGAVHRYTPDGVLDAVIQIPTPKVTARTFGGPDLSELYITTSALGLGESDALAGPQRARRIAASSGLVPR